MDRYSKQSKSFASGMAGAAAIYAKKVSSAAPAPSSQKSVKVEPGKASLAVPSQAQKVVFSQPQETGKGNQIQTNVVYAVDYLKDKMDKWITFGVILSYLSLTDIEESYKVALRTILANHSQVEFSKKSGDENGSFRFKPKLNIRSADDLLAALQSMTSFRGIDVKDLKEGWPNVDETINVLEAAHKILVTRHKKDNAPRFVYPDDPSLYFQMDSEFKGFWLGIKLAEYTDAAMLEDAVLKANQTPANKQKKVDKGPVRKVEKKARKTKSGGKRTNTHLVGVLKNYDNKRR